MAPYFADVQAQAGIGEPLPVGHGGTVKTAAFRNGISGFRIVINAFAFGVIHLSVKVGGVVFFFGDHGIVARPGRIRLDAGGKGEVHGDQAVHQVLASLVVQGDEDLAGFFPLAFQQGVILVHVVRFPVVLARRKVRVRGRMERIPVFRDGFVQGAGVRQGCLSPAGMGTGRPPHDEHGEDGQEKERLHKR